MDDERIDNNETNPTLYIESFRNSEPYKEFYTKFYEGKKVDPGVTEDEKIEFFEEDEKARKALINYAEEGNLFKYDPASFGREARTDIDEYIALLKDLKKGHFQNTRASIIAFDQVRGSLHNKAADSICDEGITHSHKLARGLLQLISVEKNLESFGHVEKDENNRIISIL